MALERPLESLTDDEVISGLDDLLGQSRRLEAPLVAHIGEVEVRRLYARYAASSIFSYCTDVLRMSEGEAYLRTTVAKAAREHPVILEMLADGQLHLSGIAKLAPVLTAENRDALLARAVHKSKRQILQIVAELAPRPDVPPLMRKLPERAAASPDASLVQPASPLSPSPANVDAPSPARIETPRLPTSLAPALQPLSRSRYKVQFTAGPELHDDLEALRALMRSEVPDGDLALIIGRAVREMRQRIEARRFAQTKSPRKKAPRPDDSSRYVPAEIRRFVYRRDGGQCRYVDAHEGRCQARHRLEYHHEFPFGLGGGHDVENICLMCRPHNRYLAELDYGKEKMDQYRRLEGKAAP
jgi:hypothetical protein